MYEVGSVLQSFILLICMPNVRDDEDLRLQLNLSVVTNFEIHPFLQLFLFLLLIDRAEFFFPSFNVRARLKLSWTNIKLKFIDKLLEFDLKLIG